MRAARTRHGSRILVLIASGFAWPALAMAQSVGYSASVYGLKASHDRDSSAGLYLFNTVDLAAGPIRVSAGVPFIWQRSTLLVDPGDGALQEIEQTATGFADPLFRVDGRVVGGVADAFQLGLAAAIKPPIAGTELSTGKTDIAFGASGFGAIGRTSILADILYWKYGDPTDVDFPNVVAYSIGLGRATGSGRWSILVSIAGASASLDGTPAPIQLNVGVLTLRGGRQSLAITSGFGLSDSTSDLSVGITWRVQR